MREASPDESNDLEQYQLHPDKAAGEWLSFQGAKWATRNPVDVEATDESFRTRYGLTKTWAVRDALRSVPRETSCLEVGCSAGGFLAVLRSLGFASLTGTDISLEPLLSQARPRALVHADAYRLPFRDRSFDMVVTAGTLMHLGPDKRMTESLQGLARLTRRWIFVAELYAPGPTPMLVSFGELLPPVWLYAWDVAIPNCLGRKKWAVTYHQVYDLGRGHTGLLAPLCFTLLERAPKKS